MKRLIILLISLVMLNGCNIDLQQQEIRGFAMDAPYSIKTAKLSSDTGEKVKNYLKNTDRIFSAYSENSYLSKLNREKQMFFSQAEPEKQELYRLISFTVPYCNDYFDISVRPISKLWDFKAEVPKLPEAELLQKHLRAVGIENVILEKDRVTLKNQAELELGAVAKGYVCDVVADMLEETDAIVDIGGTVKAVGKEIVAGIKSPDGSGILCSFSLPEGMAVSTSGSYERNFTLNGQKYHHILNPKNGYPVDTELVSVSVISDSALLSDILSTTFFAMENPQIPEGVEAIFVTENKQIYTTNGIKNLKLLNDNYQIKNTMME